MATIKVFLKYLGLKKQNMSLTTTASIVNACRPSTHSACRSSDPAKLIPYLIEKNEKPVYVSRLQIDKISIYITLIGKKQFF